jgi:putative transposase
MTMATNYTYKFRLQPNASQASRLSQHFGVCRYVYNHFLDQRNQSYRNTGKGSTYHKDCAALTVLKKELTWISDANSQSLQQELKNLDTSFNRFFKKQARFPKFHSKHKDKQSFRVPQFVVVKDGNIHFPKFREGIKFKQHRPIEGEIKYATVSRNRAGQHYVCICVEREMTKLKPNDNAVGVDLGLKDLATCSNGEVFSNIRPYRNLQRHLRRLQQSVSRKVKGSHNWTRAKGLVAKLHQKIADIRSNHLHQVSKSLVNENQVIVLEDLNIKGMMANRCLAKSVADVSLHELVRQIEYKAGWYGREVIRVGRWYPSSKTCHVCDFINQNLTLSDREWTCPRCKTEHDRDYNASVNILGEGLRQRYRTVGTTGIACGEGVRLPQGSDSRRSTEAAGSLAQR